MPCGVSLKGVTYKMKFYCIAIWIQRGHIILMQNVFNNISNLLNQFLFENTEWEGGNWVGNQVIWLKNHLNFPSQVLVKAGARITEGGCHCSGRPLQHAPVYTFNCEGQTFS